MDKKFIETIKRGVLEIISEDGLKEKISSGKPLRVKLGVDPTAPDLHLGHTVLLRKLRQFQDGGHRVIFIIGDFTARIGDPSGQDKTRPMMSEKEILKNAKTYQEQVFKILDEKKTEIVYNSQWLYPLGLQGLLELASRSTVSQMIQRADFKDRMQKEEDITILEFIYPLLQGYDSVAIKADIELGGIDQKFNLLMGRSIQKKYGQPEQVVIMMPLLVGLDGTKKMSKSYKNYIALNDPPDEMFGKIMSLPDTLMKDYYELLTAFPMDEINLLIKENPKEAKIKLASEITGQYYGEEKARRARLEFEKVFTRKELPDEIQEFKTKKTEWRAIDLLFCAGLVSSRNEARRLLLQGAVDVDGETLKEDKQLKIKNGTIIKAGKRKFIRVIMG
ncbi:MAG: tyrosine--tRNA ligase [Elusimicrobiota bacterium]